MLKREFCYFLVALQFLTRIPVRSFDGFEAEWLDRSSKYFPLVGAIVGAICAAVLLISAIVLPQPIPMLLALIAGVAVTGAFHEDGLADTADGLGGGHTVAQRLEIMKDSRIGTYGAVTLILVLGLKFAGLASLDPAMAARALIAAHAGGRLATVFAVYGMTYAGDADKAKVKPLATSLTQLECLLAVALGLIPATCLLPFTTVCAGLGLGFCGAAVLALMSYKSIGGYTGDVLGAIEQVFETAFLLGVVAVVAGPG